MAAPRIVQGTLYKDVNSCSINKLLVFLLFSLISGKPEPLSPILPAEPGCLSSDEVGWVKF